MGDIDKEIELGARSIRVSYRSYLSDAAPGFALILILFFSYFYPILGIPLKELYPFSNLPSEILIFISVLLFFFSVPLGLTLNDLYNLTIGYLCCQTKEECPENIGNIRELVKLLLLNKKTFWMD
ncbi:hypothetical protein METP3_02145 [Methanosarcinales archaeon]|nr:hypothetical protein METP3_02145 [Methanosarcinales archaeon]